MANVAETDGFTAGVRQFEVTDLVQGGVAGADNVPLRSLASRTAWLKVRADEVDAAHGTFPSLPDRLNAADVEFDRVESSLMLSLAEQFI